MKINSCANNCIKQFVKIRKLKYIESDEKLEGSESEIKFSRWQTSSSFQNWSKLFYSLWHKRILTKQSLPDRVIPLNDNQLAIFVSDLSETFLNLKEQMRFWKFGQSKIGQKRPHGGQQISPVVILYIKNWPYEAFVQWGLFQVPWFHQQQIWMNFCWNVSLVHLWLMGYPLGGLSSCLCLFIYLLVEYLVLWFIKQLTSSGPSLNQIWI